MCEQNVPEGRTPFIQSFRKRKSKCQQYIYKLDTALKPTHTFNHLVTRGWWFQTPSNGTRRRPPAVRPPFGHRNRMLAKLSCETLADDRRPTTGHIGFRLRTNERTLYYRFLCWSVFFLRCFIGYIYVAWKHTFNIKHMLVSCKTYQKHFANTMNASYAFHSMRHTRFDFTNYSKWEFPQTMRIVGRSVSCECKPSANFSHSQISLNKPEPHGELIKYGSHTYTQCNSSPPHSPTLC